MTLPFLLTRLARRSWRERADLAEAVIVLALASLAIRLLPFRMVVGSLGHASGRSEGDSVRREQLTREALRAIRAAAPYLPWRIVCFQKGLALHVMLRRRKVPNLLHYGVRQSHEEGVSAHVWVSSGGVDLIGGEEAHRFACLATFPAASAQA